MKLLLYTFIIITLHVSSALAQNEVVLTFDGIYAEDLRVQETIETSASRVLSEIRGAYNERRPLNLSASATTAEGKKSIETLWSATPFSIADNAISTYLIVKGKPVEGYEIRDIILHIDPRNTGTQTISEKGVLLFDTRGRVDGIYFGIDTSTHEALSISNSDADEYWDKQDILDFVDHFRTSYNNKQIEEIEKVFSEHALIIVGRVVMIEPDPANRATYKDREKVQLISRSKDEYLTELRKAFNANEYINVSFEKITIERDSYYKNLYIVKMVQHWTSSSYADSGYLFLLIDMKNKEKPLIHVRAWQDKEKTDINEVIGIEDFVIPNP